MSELSREQVEAMRQRAELCAEATLPGDQFRALVDLALLALPKQADTGDGPVCRGADKERTREQVKGIAVELSGWALNTDVDRLINEWLDHDAAIRAESLHEE